MKFEQYIPDSKVRDLVKDILLSLPECSYSLKCTKFNYEAHEYSFLDYEEGKPYFMTLGDAVEGFERLVKEWLRIGTYTLSFMLDAGNWDAPMIDALVQQATMGEVVYS